MTFSIKGKKPVLGTIYDQVRHFLDELDRSKLGIFAIDKGVLYTALLTAIVTGDKKATKKYSMKFLDSISHSRKLLSDESKAEADFWLERDEVDRALDIDAEALSHVRIAYDHDPRYHDFFIRGIWDTAFVAHCIENDIDAELAVSAA